MTNEDLSTTNSTRPDNIDVDKVRKEAKKEQAEKKNNKDPKTHEVELGDSLTTISVKYDIPQDVLVKLNDIEDPNVLTIGQKLRLTDEVS